MKPMNFEFLNKIAREEVAPPLVCPSLEIENEMSPLGALIWNARVHMNLSQDDFAKRCDIDAEDVTRLEDDPEYSPDLRTLHSISDFLKLKKGMS